jgi:hypothetical protein
MTTAEKAKQIRQGLKVLGINSRSVSVRSDVYSMGATIRVLIMDGAVKKAPVEAIARQAEDVRRDEASGEILSGGNTFVTVEYATTALAARRAEIAPAINALAETGVTAEIGHGLRAAFIRDGVGSGYVIVKDAEGEEIVHCWGRDFAIRQLAEWLANREPVAEAA